LGAAGFADQVVAAARVGVGYGGVYDLDEFNHVFQERALKNSRHFGPLSFSFGEAERPLWIEALPNSNVDKADQCGFEQGE